MSKNFNVLLLYCQSLYFRNQLCLSDLSFNAELEEKIEDSNEVGSFVFSAYFIFLVIF